MLNDAYHHCCRLRDERNQEREARTRLEIGIEVDGLKDDIEHLKRGNLDFRYMRESNDPLVPSVPTAFPRQFSQTLPPSFHWGEAHSPNSQVPAWTLDPSMN